MNISGVSYCNLFCLLQSGYFPKSYVSEWSSNVTDNIERWRQTNRHIHAHTFIRRLLDTPADGKQSNRQQPGQTIKDGGW